MEKERGCVFTFSAAVSSRNTGTDKSVIVPGCERLAVVLPGPRAVDALNEIFKSLLAERMVIINLQPAIPSNVGPATPEVISALKNAGFIFLK